MQNNFRSRTPQATGDILANMPGIASHMDIRPKMEVVDDSNYPFKPIYPLLDREAQAEILRRYKHYEKSYNKTVSRANRENAKFNQDMETIIAQEEHAKTKKIQQVNFIKNYVHLGVWEYNAKAREYNVKFGPTIPFRKIQKLRDTHETFFRLIIWEYAHQLRKYTKLRQAAGIAYVRAVPQYSLNTKHLQNTKGPDGLYMTNVHKNTLLNRKDRLIEAGILQNNVHRGSKRGTLHHIAPQIFAVFDCFDEKLTTAENQLLTEVETQKLCDTVLTTGTISKSLIKEPVNSLIDKDKTVTGFEPINCPADGFTGTPDSNMENPGTESKPAAANFSQKLMENTLETWQLAQKCTALEFDGHKPIDPSLLDREAREGTLSRSEFREVLCKEIFKMASNLYHGKHIYPGEWVKAYRQFQNSVMRTQKGEVLHKDKALQVYLTMIFALTDHKIGAKKVSNYSKFSFAPPSWYLDPMNKLPGSFAHWYKQVSKKMMEKAQKRAETTKNQANENKKRQADYHNNRKMERQLQRYHKNAITLPQLLEYVENNLPRDYRKTLTERMARFSNGLRSA